MKFVCHKENFSNFVFGEHSDYCLYYFVIEHYKGTTIFANHQIYRQLYFIELTLIRELYAIFYDWSISVCLQLQVTSFPSQCPSCSSLTSTRFGRIYECKVRHGQFPHVGKPFSTCGKSGSHVWEILDSLHFGAS